jgi:hypothetical protein
MCGALASSSNSAAGAGLADAGLARDQDDLAFATCRLIPTPAQQLDFLRAAD